MNISWTSDGTSFAAGGGNGRVCFAQLVDRRLDWRNLQVVLQDASQIVVQDILSETVEELEFKDRVCFIILCNAVCDLIRL